ncbi:hypothetical protein QFZ65_003699 [Arthrobacter sp. B3I9]|nr:hypothetical protein [Arthrobacter sp. B3I9]
MGLEDIEDILWDLDQALDAASAVEADTESSTALEPTAETCTIGALS